MNLSYASAAKGRGNGKGRRKVPSSWTPAAASSSSNPAAFPPLGTAETTAFPPLGAKYQPTAPFKPKTPTFPSSSSSRVIRDDPYASPPSKAIRDQQLSSSSSRGLRDHRPAPQATSARGTVDGSVLPPLKSWLGSPWPKTKAPMNTPSAPAATTLLPATAPPTSATGPRTSAPTLKPSYTSTTKVESVKKPSLIANGYKNMEDWLSRPETLYIGRAMNYPACRVAGSKWGNPFPLKKYSIDDCLRLYEEHVRNGKLWNDLEELEGKTLGCWCKPAPCHGDVLVRLLEEKKRMAA